MTTVAEKARSAYGKLPENWTSRRLRFDVRLNPKKSALDMKADELVSFIPMDAVGEHGGLRLDENRELADVYEGYTYFEDGDLCIAKITPCFENGKGALAEGLTNGVGFGTTELHVVRPGPGIDRRFLFYISIADDFRKIGESEMYGAGGQKRIDEGFIKDWMPPLPPLETQRRIAQFLDEKTACIDGLIEKKRALLERLAEKRQALITRAVTKGLNPDAPMKPSGIDWLGDIPAHWDALPLRRILEIPLSNGIFKRKADFGEGALLINVFDVYRPDLKINYPGLDRVRCDENEIEKYEVAEGDILFVRSSLKMQGIAVAAIAQNIPEDIVFECHLVRARCRHDRILPRFISFVLASAPYRARLMSLAKTTTMTTLEQESLNSLYLTVPPLNEQTVVAEFLEKEMARIDNFGNHIEASIHRLHEYRSALITAAVTGQIEGLQ